MTEFSLEFSLSVLSDLGLRGIHAIWPKWEKDTTFGGRRGAHTHSLNIHLIGCSIAQIAGKTRIINAPPKILFVLSSIYSSCVSNMSGIFVALYIKHPLSSRGYGE